MTSWEDLPGETRNQIYRYLLTSDTKAKPQGDEFILLGQFHPAILRTCKSVHDEAISILYEENFFCFEYRLFPCIKMAYGDDYLFHSSRPAIKNLRRTKNVSLLLPH